MVDIAFFMVSLDGGGAEKVMLALADGFAARGFNVDLVIAKLEGDYLSLISPKVRLVNLHSPRLIGALPSLLKYLKATRPRVLISALEDPNSIAILAKLLARVPTRFIVTVHNHLTSYSKQSPEFKARLRPWFVRRLFPYADGIVTVSQGVADDAAKMSGLSPQRIDVIYNPVFTPEVLTKIEEPIDHPWFGSERPPVILAVGRLTKEKDFGTLIRAFALLRQQFDLKLTILGQGEELSNLKLIVEELNLVNDVIFPGFVENPYAYMKQAKLLAMSSSTEGFGNVLVEAMLAGTPVVATNCEGGGPAEILANGKYGKLVSVGDVAGLAAAIVDTMNYPIDPSILQQRGREFSADAALDRYQQIIDREPH